MGSQDKSPRPERVKTDRSLQAERAKADKAFTKRDSALEKDAEQVVQLARDRADSLLEAARQKADMKLRQADGQAEVTGSLSVARASEDDAVIKERAAADDKLEAERAEQKQAFTLLLAIEREETDERLLTERARADHAVASRDDFLAMVSHDVRGILGGMAMSAELLMRISPEDPTRERVHREAQRIRRLTGQMNRLIADLLDVVSMESGKLSVVATRQDATRLLTETMESFQLTAAARKIVMTSQVGPGRALASFDHERILQVLGNLVGNAMKFTKAGGSIELFLTPAQDEIRFTVRDSGCGIAADQLDAIFERFSQGAQVDRRGLGLGLYIARCIVATHGGKIWVQSEPGKGSAFHFTLPDTQQRETVAPT